MKKMTVNDFILEKCIQASPTRPKDLHKYYNEFKYLSKSNCKISTFKRDCSRVFDIWKAVKAKTLQEVKAEEVGRVEQPNGQIESNIVSSKMITSVEEMAKFCNIDPSEYLKPKIVTNRWGSADNPNWQFKVFWVPKYGVNELKPKDAISEFERLLKETNIQKIKIEQECKNNNDTTVVIGASDWHIGSLSWKQELSSLDAQNYDLEIAEVEIKKAIDFFFEYYRNNPPKQFILPLGNDGLNITNDKNQTVNGTVQDEAGRPRNAFAVALRIYKYVIEEGAKIAKMKGVYIPANHDLSTSYFLSSCLYESYVDENIPSEDRHIDIDISASDRKYFKIGNTLVGLCHGKSVGAEVKPERLVALMSSEAKNLWGECKYYEWLTGHLHTMKNYLSKDFNEVVVRTMPTILVPSYWANASGYTSVRQMHCYEYGNNGIEGIKIYRP